MRRAAFTLTEVLVALMILSVVSVAMVLTLNTAVRIYRAGEASRAANDQAIAILSRLEQDLDGMLPPAPVTVDPSTGSVYRPTTGGWIYAAVNSDSSGDCRVAWTIRNPERGKVTSDGKYSETVVMWRRIGDALHRVGNDIVSDGVTERSNVQAPDPSGGDKIADGVLYLGAWIAIQELDNRAFDPSNDGWDRTDNDASVFPPSLEATYNTQDSVAPYPSALRIAVILNGGTASAPTGTLRTAIDGEATTITIAGLSQIPVSGYIQVGTEWMRIIGAQGAQRNVERGALRSTPNSHPAGERVRTGSLWSLVRAVPK
jgi:prepilin-type N-terminal cleavage/methylation domain-containing protein